MLEPEPEARPATAPRTGERITTDAELAAYLRDTYGIVLPDAQVCPNHSTPWRAFKEAYFARSPVTVWKASRGFGGKSFTLSLLGMVEATTLHADVNVLGGSGEQSQRVLEAMDKLWQHPSAPRELLASDPAKRETSLRTGNKLRALMASTRSVRGPHPQRLRMDEVDEMKLTIVDAALGQTMAQMGIPAQTVLSSTHHYSDGTMTKVLQRAKERGWPVHEWCWRETVEPRGWLPIAEVDRKRLEVTDQMWAAEYDLQEPTSEGRAIVTEKVEAMFDKALGEFTGADGEYIEIEAPVPGGRYATGGDWARKQDNTAIGTYRIDVKPMKLVAFERMNRRPWPVMIERFNARVKRYPGTAAHDATGIGDVVDGYLTVQAEPVMMVGRDRADTLSEYIAGIERGEIVAPRIAFMYGEHKFASSEVVYGSEHPPDTFVAGALAYRASRGGGFFEYARRAHEEAARAAEQRQQATEGGGA